MFCPGCGEKILLLEQIFTTQFVICEKCEHEFSIKDNGKVSREELVQARRGLQAGFEEEARKHEYMDKQKFQKVVSKLTNVNNISESYNNMYDPERDRNVEAPGDIRARE